MGIQVGQRWLCCLVICIFGTSLIGCGDARSEREKARDALFDAEWDVAIAGFTKAIQENPENKHNYMGRATAYRWLNEVDKSIDDYTSYLDLAIREYDKEALARKDYSPTIDTRPIAIGYCHRGGAHSKNGDFEKAIDDYTESIAAYPYFSDVYTNRAEAYESLGLSARAKQDREKAASVR